MKPLRKAPPSLVDICIRTAIDNIRYIGDVGEMDLFLLKDILPHATVDQLMHIETASEGRDLSPVTDELWRRFYGRAFGAESVDLVVKWMKQKRVVFKWKDLYEEKKKEREEAQRRSVEKFRQRYAEDLARKRSRQVQPTSKVPPSSRKRSFSGGNGSSHSFSNVKGSLMKKAKMEYLSSHEAQVHAAMRKKASQRPRLLPQSVPRLTNTGGFLGKGSASCSKLSKPLARR